MRAPFTPQRAFQLLSAHDLMTCLSCQPMIMLPEVIVVWGSTRLTLALIQLAILAIAFYIAFYIGPRLASSSSMFFVLPGLERNRSNFG